MRRHRSAKIVATLGPSSADEATVRALFETGVDVFRLNFSHASHAEHRARHALVRAVEDAVGRPVGILADLQGPKLRIGTFSHGEVTLVQGQRFTLTLGQEPGDETRAPVPHPEIFAALAPGAEVLLDDGRVRLRVAACGPDHAETVVVTPGVLSDRKGLNLPGVTLPLDAITPKDREDLAFALELGVDWVALSFVQGPEDIRTARRLVPDHVSPSSPSWKNPRRSTAWRRWSRSPTRSWWHAATSAWSSRPKRCRPRRSASFVRHGRRASRW